MDNYKLISEIITCNVPILPVKEKAGEQLVELKPKIDSLSFDQQEALAKIIISDANTVVISGNAGTGKTTVQKLASEILTTIFDCEVVKTSAYGIAALNMGGATLSSTFGLTVNHILPWFDDYSKLDFRKEERDWGSSQEDKEIGVRRTVNELFGKLKRNRRISFSKKHIFWFVDEFSTITSEQLLVCYQLLKRLNPTKTIKVVAFGQPIQMLPVGVGTDDWGLNCHSRAWDKARFHTSGYYQSVERYPVDEHNPKVYADSRKGSINFAAELSTYCGGDKERIIRFIPTNTVEYGSLLINGQGPTVKPNKDWTVVYHCLTKNHRQGESLAYANICTAIAEGKAIEPNEFWKPLLDRIVYSVDRNKLSKAVWLVRTHKTRQSINESYLKKAKHKNPGSCVTYRAKIGIGGKKGYIDSVDTKKEIIYFYEEDGSKTPFSYGYLPYARIVSNFFNNITIPVKQELVSDLPVISRLNDNKLNIANGTVGHVILTEDKQVKVFRPDTGEEQEWGYCTPSFVPKTSEGMNLFEYQCLPCHQANALTFQACQGLTITSEGVIYVDPEMLKGERGYNSAGSMYVNLTRFTDLNNVIIKVPNDAYTDAHMLNEVIFMDESSVKFMDFLKEATTDSSKTFENNGAKEVVVEEVEEVASESPEKVDDYSIEYYTGCTYKNNSISLVVDGQESIMPNLAEPQALCGLNVFVKNTTDCYFDILIWFFEGECKSSEEAEKYIISRGLIDYLKANNIDYKYIVVAVGEMVEDSTNELEPEESITEPTEEVDSELDHLRKENEELRAQLANSVSRTEFDELKDQLAKVLAMLDSKK